MLRFLWPEKKKKIGPNWTNKITTKEFERLFLVKDMPHKDWKKIINDNFKNSILYDKNNKQFSGLINKLN
jgi:surface carbohydrate biosynthesis protein